MSYLSEEMLVEMECDRIDDRLDAISDLARLVRHPIRRDDLDDAEPIIF